MKSSFGNSVSVTISGESHGGALVAVLSGLAPGIPVDEGFIAAQLTKRRPAGITPAKPPPWAPFSPPNRDRPPR